MATFFSDTRIGFWNASNNYLIGTLTGDVSRSGNTVTLYNMNLSIRATYSSWGNDYYTFTVNGTNTGATVYANGYDMGSYGLNSTSFSVSTAQTSADVGWSTSDGYSGSFTVWFSSGVSSPSTPSVSVQEIYTDGAKFSVSISSYGNPSGEYNRYIEAGILNQNSYGNSYRYSISYRTTSASITVNNASSTGSNPLTIRPNTRYWYGGWATNTQASSSTVSGQFVTKAKAAIITPSQIGTDFATFSYSTEADGGYYNKTIQYSIDGGTTWTTIATVSGGSAASGAFTVSNLTAGTRYNLQTRVTTTSGTTNGTVVPFIAKTGLVTAFYGSANNQSVKTIDFYGSVGGQSQRIKKLYGPSEFPESFSVEPDGTVVTAIDGVKLCAMAKSQYPSTYKQTVSFTFSYSSGTYYASGEDRNGVSTFYRSGGATALANAGVIFSPSVTSGASVTLAATYNEAIIGTKLIHQGFGHFPHYGQIVYYTDAGHTDTGVILLKSQSQINQLCGSWQGWETEIEGVQLNSADIKEVYIGKQAESIPQGFLIACSSIDTVDLSESEITSIPSNFLSYCSNFNGTLKLPPATQTIGSFFLYEAKHFNQPLTIPTGVTSINYNFLYNASDFNQPITLPPSLVSLSNRFLYGCNKMTSTVNVGSLSADIATDNERTFATNSSSAAMYTTGITIAGSNRAAWLTKFPNSNSVPFRKLIDAGY